MGGRGGTEASANWVQGFLKNAGRNVDDDKEYADIQAAKNIHKRLTKAKDESKVEPRGGWDQFIENRVLTDWSKDSDVVLYNEKTNKLTISPGKLTEARREFEKYVKNKYRKYYKRASPNRYKT